MTTENAKSNGQLFVGTCVVTGKKLHLPYDQLTQHISVCGATGAGTSILRKLLIKNQINNGGGLLVINSCLSNHESAELYKTACLAGRESDLVIINLCDPQEVSSRIMSLLPDTAGNVGADFFRASARQALETIINAFQCLGKPYNLEDLASVMLSEQAVMEVERRLLKDHEDACETVQFLALLSRYKTAKGFDMEKFKETLGGLASRLHEFSTDTFERVMNTYNTEVNLEECILQNKIILVIHPQGMDNKKWIEPTKLFIADLRDAISHLQRTPANELPNPPFLFIPNDCAPYIDKSWSRVFEQARTSRISIATMFQSLVDLQPAGDETNSDIVMGNTKFKFFFKQLTLESAQKCADEIGTCAKVQIKNGETNPSSEETYIISPEQLQSIPVGDCLLLIGGEELYRLRLPSPNNQSSN